MRYYVIAIQHNKEAQAENRTVPKAYDTRNEAIREFHRQLSTDMNNSTLDWSLCMVVNSEQGIEASERWDEDVTPQVEVAEE